MRVRGGHLRIAHDRTRADWSARRLPNTAASARQARLGMRPHASRRPQASCSSPLRTDRLDFLRLHSVRVLAKPSQLDRGFHQNSTFDPGFRFGSAARPGVSPRQTDPRVNRQTTPCLPAGARNNRELCEHLARHPAHAPSAHEPAHRPHTHPHRYAPGTCGLGTPWRPRHTRPYIHGTPSLGHAPADAPSASNQLRPIWATVVDSQNKPSFKRRPDPKRLCQEGN